MTLQMHLVLKQKLLDEKYDNDALTKQMKKVIIEDLPQRYSSETVKTVIDIACFIDPRFKDCSAQNKDDTISCDVMEAVKLAETISLLTPHHHCSRSRKQY